MAKRKPKTETQTSDWHDIADELDWHDVGARLLANIARGMYSPQAVLREYVQNAVDAYKDLNVASDDHLITISADGDNLSIQDFGVGMNVAGIKDAKKIAVSTKSDHDDRVGFRGIGIWAGLPACKRLIVDSTTAGDPYRYRLTFEFEEIRRHLDDNIHIKDLIDPRYKIQQMPAKVDEHFTRVTLEGVTDGYRQLLDPPELIRIASQVLPSAIDPKFQHHATLQKLLDKWPGYYECHIHIQTPSGKVEAFRQFPSDDIEPPEEVILKSAQGVELGRAWYCRTKNTSLRKVVSPAIRGFQLRVKNFAVGEPNMFSAEQGYSYNIQQHQTLKTTVRLSWFCGELHVTNNDIKPNTPRDDLERDQAARLFIETLRGFYRERITEAGAYSDFNPFKAALDEAEDIVATLKNGTDGSKTPSVDKIKSLLQKLNEVPEKSKEKSEDQSGKLLHDLLRQKGFKDRCTKVITALRKAMPAIEAVNATAATSRQTASAKTSTQSSSKKKPATSGDAGRAAGQSGSRESLELKSEEIVSEVFDVLERYLGSDHDELPQIQVEIQRILDTWITGNA